MKSNRYDQNKRLHDALSEGTVECWFFVSPSTQGTQDEIIEDAISLMSSEKVPFKTPEPTKEQQEALLGHFDTQPYTLEQETAGRAMVEKLWEKIQTVS